MKVQTTGLLWLAAELIESIRDNLCLQDLKSLRLVCSQLNLAVEPVVLSYLVIDASNRTHKTTIRQLKALANQNSRACELTRQLKIASLYPKYDSSLTTQFAVREPSGKDVEDNIRKYLASAVSSLKQVESIM
jgi:hypothetical protein